MSQSLMKFEKQTDLQAELLLLQHSIESSLELMNILKKAIGPDIVSESRIKTNLTSTHMSLTALRVSILEYLMRPY